MAGKLFLFTQQTIGLGARKTSVIFMAEAFAGMGYDVHIVTVQISLLSSLKGDSRLASIPADRRNIWYDAEGMKGFVWVPPAHPVSASGRIGQAVTAPLSAIYGWLLPPAVKERVAGADVVIIESCAAVALFPRLKRLAGQASFVYSMSDRLEVVGMHPRLQVLLERYASSFDLVRVPARAMVDDLPGANVHFLPQGIDKDAFEGDPPSPYGGGKHAILIGDMMLDRPVLLALITSHTDTHFHYFGRVPLSIGAHVNLTEHGETPFAQLVPFIRHADVGLSLYRFEEGLDYLAESSLKNVQYTYSGLPLVCPQFVARGKSHVFPYDAGDAEGAVAALTRALEAGRRSLGAGGADDWRDIARQMIALTGRPGGTQS